jgi:hypothetical protein
MAVEVWHFSKDTLLSSGDAKQIASAQEQHFELNLTYMRRWASENWTEITTNLVVPAFQHRPEVEL